VSHKSFKNANPNSNANPNPNPNHTPYTTVITRILLSSAYTLFNYIR